MYWIPEPTVSYFSEFWSFLCSFAINVDADFFVIFLGEFAVTGPTGRNPLYSDCVYAMSQLAYFCDTGGLKTWQGYQYKLDPNDGGSC
jgi:hypothetical protein